MGCQFYVVLLGCFDELAGWLAAVRQANLRSLRLPSGVFDLGDELVQLDRTEIGNTELSVREFGSK